jgi:hypothetical protein
LAAGTDEEATHALVKNTILVLSILALAPALMAQPPAQEPRSGPKRSRHLIEEQLDGLPVARFSNWLGCQQPQIRVLATQIDTRAGCRTQEAPRSRVTAHPEVIFASE